MNDAHGRGGLMRTLRMLAIAAAVAALPRPAMAQQPMLLSLSGQSLLDRPARLDLARAPLSHGLQQLHARSGVPLAYSPSLMPAEREVSCACFNVTVGEALDRMLRDTGFRYEDLGGQVLIERASPAAEVAPAPALVLPPAPQPVAPVGVPAAVETARRSLWQRLSGGIGSLFTRGAPGVIQGRVTDAASGDPLTAVQVIVSGTSLSALSDESGAYRIAGVPPGLYTVEARRLGYADARRENVTVPDGGTVTVDLELKVTALALEEIVATGIVDPTSARRVPFTVARISADKLQVPSENAINALQGKVAGANIVTSAQPGSGVNIVLRSPTSIYKSNSPLIVVDGVILASTFGRSSADLDALDIESIEVVKGAAASSMYGSRAANGVIQIRTRRGAGLEDGDTRITVRSEFGQNQLSRRIDRATHHHYLVNAGGQYVDADGNPVDREDRVERPASERFLDQPYPDPVYDHVEQFFDPGTYAINSVSLAQNSGSTNFYASYANHQIDGVVLAHGGFEKNDVRINLDHRLRSNLSFAISGYHMRSTRDGIPGGTFFDLIQQAPDMDLLQPDPDGTEYIWQPDPLGVTPNPLYALSVQEDEEDRVRTLANANLRYSPTGWLSFDGNMSYDRSDREQFFFFPRGKKTDVQQFVGGNVERGSGETTAMGGSLSANLRRSFGDFATRLTLRALMGREDYNFFSAQGSSLTVEGVPDLNAGSIPTITGSTQEIREEGYFAIGGLDYAGKYIVDALVRRDGSSLFGPEERWHTYYRGSVAWRMAEEPWWPLDQVQEFKVRYSRGTAGGRPSFGDRFETYGFSSSGGLVKNTLGNRFLKPERATEQEFGVDAILHDRFSVQLNYARVVTEDQLVAVPLPAGFGFSSQWQNAGTVEGNTWEATVEAQVLTGPALQLTLGMVADRSRHEITEFNRTCFRTGSSNQLFRCEGETLGVMYGNHFLRNPDELPEGAPADEFQVNDDGLLVWVGPGGDWRSAQWGTSTDIDGLNYGWGLPILALDSTGVPTVERIGDANADLHLGFTGSIRWKNVSIFGLLDTQIGGDVYNRTNQRMYQYFRSGDADQAGRPEERKKTTDYFTSLYAANLINDWFVEPGGYVKLRELSMTWDLPRSILESVRLTGLDGLSIFAIGRNLFTISDYRGYDPEAGTPLERLDDFVYPQYRTLTAGVQLRF